MPLRTWRWSRQRPPRRGVIAGSKGASRAHSSSVSSNRLFTAGFYRISRAPPKPTHRSEKHALAAASSWIRTMDASTTMPLLQGLVVKPLLRRLFYGVNFSPFIQEAQRCTTRQEVTKVNPGQLGHGRWYIQT
jgi:hypothetical protein